MIVLITMWLGRSMGHNDLESFEHFDRRLRDSFDRFGGAYRLASANQGAEVRANGGVAEILEFV